MWLFLVVLVGTWGPSGFVLVRGEHARGDPPVASASEVAAEQVEPATFSQAALSTLGRVAKVKANSEARPSTWFVEDSPQPSRTDVATTVREAYGTFASP